MGSGAARGVSNGAGAAGTMPSAPVTAGGSCDGVAAGGLTRGCDALFVGGGAARDVGVGVGRDAAVAAGVGAGVGTGRGVGVGVAVSRGRVRIGASGSTGPWMSLGVGVGAVGRRKPPGADWAAAGIAGAAAASAIRLAKAMCRMISENVRRSKRRWR
jgi:hypothetical protein